MMLNSAHTFHRPYLGNIHAGVVVDLGLLDHNVVIAVADVRDVSARKVPGLDPVGEKC